MVNDKKPCTSNTTLKPLNLIQPIRVFRNLVPAVVAVFAAAWCSAATPDPAATPTPTLRKLSLSDCYQLAIQHNLDLQIERLSTRIADANLSGTYGAYEPILNFSATKSYLDQPSLFSPTKAAGDAPYELTTTSFGGGVSGKAPVGFSYDIKSQINQWHALTDFNLTKDAGLFTPSGLRTTNQDALVSGIFLKQSLLKDFWTDSDRLKIQVAKRNLKITQLGLQDKLMNTVSSVQSAYYDAWFAREVVRIQRLTGQSSQRLLDEVRSRIQAGVLPALEEKLFEFYTSSVREDIINADRVYEEAKASLRNLISQDLKDWNGLDIDLSDAPQDIEEHFDKVGSWRDAMMRRPEIQELEADLEKQDIVLRFDRNQLYPSLDLVGSYGLSGADGVDLGLGTAESQITRGSHSFYSYGVVMSVPFSNRANRNRYKADQEVKRQSLLRMKQLEMNILTQVENSGRQMTSSFRRLEPARKSRELAEEVLKSQEAQIQLGQSTGLAVVEAQKRLTSAQIAAAKALTDYAKSRSQLALQTGVILDRNSISLEVK